MNKGLELTIPPPLIALTVALLMWGIAHLVPGAALPLPRSATLAFVVAMAGFGIALVGILQFWRASTTVNPHTPQNSEQLVQHGIYRFSRNPMYLGLAVVLLAWALYLSNGLSLFLIPGFIVYINRFQILPEERHMRALFGQSFDEYAARVRRWI
ncbi:methyltransferase family protein [Halomonadaceae bacterium KBTZ08]